MIRSTLQKKIQAAVDVLNANVVVLLEHPSNPAFGDYSTNVAMRLTKKLQKSPLEIANEIANQIKVDDLVEKIEVVKPGFINFWLKKDRLAKELPEILEKKEKYGSQNNNKTILLEFGQPNTHKLPHIGHLFSYTYGESLARNLEHVGNKLIRVNYQGDIGLHVAKCLYILQSKTGEWSVLQNAEEKVKFLQQCYQEGSKFYEEDEGVKQKIDELNKKIYNHDKEIEKLWSETREINLSYYLSFEKMLGISFQRYYFESEVGPIGKKIVEDNTPQIFTQSEGATILDGKKSGLHTRVFINKYGNPTYEAKDVGLIFLKKKEFSFDRSIVTTASEQTEYWKVIIQATKLLFPQLKDKIEHIGFGMVNLTTGKMSSRTGHIIDAISLIELVKSETKRQFQIEDDTLVEKVAIAAIKYSFLRSDIFSNISFDLEKSISREGDSGPYLLYTYVRCQSVLKEIKISNNTSYTNFNDEETQLLRSLYQFAEVIENCAQSRSVHLLTSFLFQLAQQYNLFYQKHSILKSEGETRDFRLLLTASVAQLIKNGLYLLGIETVEKM